MGGTDVQSAAPVRVGPRAGVRGQPKSPGKAPPGAETSPGRLARASAKLEWKHARPANASPRHRPAPRKIPPLPEVRLLHSFPVTNLPRSLTEKFQRFYTADFNPYLNYHRPCGFATVELASNGQRRRRYRLADYRTPCEKLLLLDDVESHLKPGITAAFLHQQAPRMSDTECALRLQQRKRKLLDACRSRR